MHNDFCVIDIFVHEVAFNLVHEDTKDLQLSSVPTIKYKMKCRLEKADNLIKVLTLSRTISR